MRHWSRFAAVACGLAMMITAGAAHAQGRPDPGAQPSTQPRVPTVGRPNSSEYFTQVERDSQRLYGRDDSMTIEEAEERFGADRVALAERVQALMDAGQCTEARRLASEAGERAMAIRVRQTCRRR